MTADGTKLTTGNITGFATSGTVAATLSGSAAIDIGTLESAAVTLDVNAATSTGGVTAVLAHAGQKFTGGSGNDVIFTEALGTTKALNGGAGVADVIAFSASTNFTAVAPLVTNFEILRVDDAGTSGGQGTYDVRNISGLTGVQIAKSAGNTSIAGLNATQSANIRIIETTGGNNLGIALADASGTSDSVTVELRSTATTATAVDASSSTNTLNGYETVNIVSNGGLATGTANKFDLDNATSAKTINISGDSAFTGEVKVASATVISGADATKALDLTLGAPTTTVTVTGGSASDTFRIAAGDLSNLITLNGAGGTGDTLAITGTAGASSALSDGQFTRLSNVEKVTVSVAQASSAADFTFAAGGFFQSTFGASGSAQFDVTIATGTTNTTSLDFSAISTNMTSALSTAVITAGKAVTLKGGTGNDTLSVVATESASANTSTPVAIYGGAGDDTLSATVTTDATGVISMTYAGGTGVDTMTASAIIDIFLIEGVSDSLTSSMDTIKSYTSATDTINLAATALGKAFAVASNVTAASGTTNGIATGLFTFDKAVATSLTDAIAKVGADVKTAGNAVVFNYGGDAYFYADMDGTAATSTDIVIKLLGTTAASMAASSEVFTIT